MIVFSMIVQVGFVALICLCAASLTLLPETLIEHSWRHCLVVLKPAFSADWLSIRLLITFGLGFSNQIFLSKGFLA